jgi:hypothetical protein
MSGRYPSEPELKEIRQWAHEDCIGLMEFVFGIWEYADIGYCRRIGRRFWFSTGGWSGNEDIVGALMDNRMFWTMCWYSSRRGGHYRFDVPKIKGFK